jgi:hypothetical protein
MNFYEGSSILVLDWSIRADTFVPFGRCLEHIVSADGGYFLEEQRPKCLEETDWVLATRRKATEDLGNKP